MQNNIVLKYCYVLQAFSKVVVTSQTEIFRIALSDTWDKHVKVIKVNVLKCMAEEHSNKIQHKCMHLYK